MAPLPSDDSAMPLPQQKRFDCGPVSLLSQSPEYVSQSSPGSQVPSASQPDGAQVVAVFFYFNSTKTLRMDPWKANGGS
jgi:hypothetical protein